MPVFLILLTLSDPSADSGAAPLIGEYLPIDTGQLTTPFGLQVRAIPPEDGVSRYELVEFAGGLPGLGFVSGGQSTEAMNTSPDQPHVGPDPQPGTRRSIRTADETAALLGEYFRVDRVSPTMGRPAPDDAIVLFDAASKSLEAWADGAVLKDGYLKSGATTKRDFGAISGHLEFRIPLQPAKLATWRGNSGVYFQTRYEVQVLESFGDVIRDNGCGAIYRIHTPPVNACLPPERWQTLDFDFQPATFEDGEKTADALLSVTLNGVKLFDRAAIPGTTGGAKLEESSTPGPLYLQDHGDPVVYRNVWVVEE